ncbi:hypothetical protein BDZ85DRAFT_296486 [Elsinoe ampelina]|uniref:Alpha-L-rhamnosidase C-terminal domain-containing protein n=1 Tax=Elsinoe ampelina TaxID=302913 RepID=A0A6A6G9P8_9PEZI|nr:hypothetical protein BDZ85DRAFT_296486 [Elsinoe ampelina]
MKISDLILVFLVGLRTASSRSYKKGDDFYPSLYAVGNDRIINLGERWKLRTSATLDPRSTVVTLDYQDEFAGFPFLDFPDFSGTAIRTPSAWTAAREIVSCGSATSITQREFCWPRPIARTTSSAQSGRLLISCPPSQRQQGLPYCLHLWVLTLKSRTLLDQRRLDFRWAKEKVPTPRGNIQAQWKLDGRSLKIGVQAPRGTRGRIVAGSRIVNMTDGGRSTAITSWPDTTTQWSQRAYGLVMIIRREQCPWHSVIVSSAVASFDKSNQTPFTSLSKAQVDSTCKCIIAVPTLGVSYMASAQVSNPQVQGLSDLQNSVAAPLSFCKVWSKISKKDASPFRNLSSIALSRVCTAILKNPKLVAPKANGSSSSSLVTSTKSSSSKVTIQTTTSSTSTTTTITTAPTDTTTSTLPTSTPNTSPISAAQLINDPLFTAEVRNQTDPNQPFLQDGYHWVGVNYKTSSVQVANVSKPLHALSLDLKKNSLENLVMLYEEWPTTEEGYYLVVVYYDAWCNVAEGCFVGLIVPEDPNETRYFGEFNSNPITPSTQMTGYPRRQAEIFTRNTDRTHIGLMLETSFFNNYTGLGAQVNFYSAAMYGPVATKEEAMRIQEIYGPTSSAE